MKTQKKNSIPRWHRILMIHLLWTNMALTQVAYGQVTVGTNAEEDQRIQSANAENLQQNQNNAEANANHDANAFANGQPNATKCRTQHDAAQDNYDMLVNFQSTYTSQGIDQLNSKINELGNNTASMERGESGLNDNPTSNLQVSLDQYNEYLRQLPPAQQRLNTAEANLNSAQARYSECNNGDGIYCSAQELQQRRTALQAAQTEFNSAQTNYNTINNGIRTYRSQAIARSTGAATGARADSARQEAVSHSQFGIDTNGNLTGSGTANYNLLTAMYNSTTDAARELASAMVEKVRNQELQAKYNADYRLYELAVDDFNPDDAQNILDSANTFSKKKYIISSMEVLAHTGAAAKDLYCVKKAVPRANAGESADSKAYYLFKAAAATYVSAEINDTNYHSGTAECRAYENFSEDDKDMQVRSVERAANLYDEVYEQLCLKINPTIPAQAEECNKFLTQIYGDYFKDGSGGYMRTREKALDILNLSLEAAYNELSDKMQKVSTAHANVKKGEAWVAKDIKTIAALTAILAIMYATNSACPGCCGCLSGRISIVLNILNFYTMIDLIKARRFLAEWQRRRDVARYHTHMACNLDTPSATEVADLCRGGGSDPSYTKNEICMNLRSGAVTKVRDAMSEKEDIRQFAIETNRQANEAVQKELERVNNLLPKEFVEQQQKTTYTPDPKLEVLALKKLAGTEKSYQATLSAYDWLRIKKGALSSLKYDDILPAPEFVEEELAKYGLELKKTIVKGARSIAEVMFPEARAAAEITENTTNKNKEISCAGSNQTGNNNTDLMACSVGVLKGSTSFSYFLVRRNLAWQNHSLDVTKSSDRVTTPIDFMSTTSGSLQDELDRKIPKVDQVGMAIPETRINSIMNLIKRIQDHMSLSKDALAILFNQRQEYITLLDRMKRRLNLGVEGLDDYKALPTRLRSATCMSMQNGEFSVDPNCSCRSTNSCSTFSYPTFDGPSAISSGSQMAFDMADASLSGNMEKANLAAGSLTQNAAKVRKRLGDALDLYNKNRQENGLPTLDDLVNQQIDAERESSYQAFASLSPALAKYENKQNDASTVFPKASGSYAHSLKEAAAKDNLAADSSKDSSKKSDVAVAYSSNSAAKASGAGSSAGLETTDNLMDFDFKADGENTIGDDFSNGLADQSAGADALYGEAGPDRDLRNLGGNGQGYDPNSTGNSYSDRGRGPASEKNGRSQINENTRVSIFKIISRRYEQSAFPHLMRKRASLAP